MVAVVVAVVAIIIAAAAAITTTTAYVPRRIVRRANKLRALAWLQVLL